MILWVVFKTKWGVLARWVLESRFHLVVKSVKKLLILLLFNAAIGFQTD